MPHAELQRSQRTRLDLAVAWVSRLKTPTDFVMVDSTHRQGTVGVRMQNVEPRWSAVSTC